MMINRFNPEKYGANGSCMVQYPNGKYIKFDDLPWIFRMVINVINGV